MDASLFRIVNGFADRTGWLHPPAVAFAKYGIAAFALVLLAGWWLGRQRPETTTLAAVACAVVAVFVALGAAQLIGHVVGRARPYDAMTGMRVLVSRTTDFSFPATTPPRQAPWPGGSGSSIDAWRRSPSGSHCSWP